MNKFKVSGLFLLLTVLVFACKRQVTRWDVKGLVPLFRTEMSLGDIDNNYLKNTSGDSSYQLVYDNLVYTGKLLEVKVPDTTINTSFTLKKLKLLDREVTQKVTLGQINPAFIFLDGMTVDVPAQDQSGLAPVNIDASEFFETATFDSGYLDIYIRNELPVSVSRIEFELRNADDNSLIGADVFLNIPENGSAVKSIDLAGKTVRKSLKGVITRLVTDASNGQVLIDAKKGVNITLSVRQLRPNSAVAAFPSQTVIDQDQGLVMDMGGPQIKYFKVKSGKLHIQLETTIAENMSMDFRIPSATKNGQDIKRWITLPGSVDGSKVVKTEVIDMAGYLLDFRGKNPDVDDTVNTFHQILKVYLDSSGRKVKITLKDSIRIYYRLDELIPEYAIGYFGNTTNPSGDGFSAFELFKGLSGNISLQKFDASILIRNSVGARGGITVNKLEGENVFSGNKIALTSTTALNSQILVLPPSFVRDDYTETEINLTESNSNIKSFMENLPQKIHYNIDIETNPSGNISAWKDFIFDNSRVEIYLRLQTPASFSIGGLVMRDTQFLDFGELKQPERLKSATLLLEIENGFPFEVALDLVLLDANMMRLDDVVFDQGNIIRPASGGIYGPGVSTSTRMSIGIPREKMEAFRKAKYIGIKANVKGGATNKKIYNSYKLIIRVNGQFEYEANL